MDFDDDDNNALGNPGDESSFSISRDDATSWNQIGLIDTDIDKLSDFVVCPDCGAVGVRKLPSAFGIGGGSNRLTASSSSCSSCSGKSCSTCR